MATSALNVKKNNYNENRKDSTIYTPPEICNFLFDILQPLKSKSVIDVCCGTGNLSNPFIDTGVNCTGIDIDDKALETYKGNYIDFSVIPFNEDYFIKELKLKNSKITKEEIENKIKIEKDKSRIEETSLLEMTTDISDLIVTNPPFNGYPGKKLFSWEILKRITELWGFDKPIVLFTLMGMRLNRRYGSKRAKEWAELEKQGLELTSIISMPIDAFFPGSKTKGQQWEILIFNAPRLKPHYWFTKEVRERYSSEKII